MNKLFVWAVAVATASGGIATPVSAQAIRAAAVSPPSVEAPLIQVRDHRYYRRHGHHNRIFGKKSRAGRHYHHRRYRHGHYHGHRHYYYRHGHRYYYNDGYYYGGAAIVGLAAGAIIAGAASTNYNTWIARCEARYRSFDRRTGAYLGYDGHRHPCRL